MSTDYSAIALALKLRFPRTYIALSRGFKGSHKGIDMCWNSLYGGQNAPVFAPADGEVVACKDGMGNTYKTGVSNWGNYVKIKHATGVYTLSAHLQKDSLKVKVGDKVKRGQQIANMNNSGYSDGSHVHFEVYVGGSGTGYRVDPLKYTYAYPDDTVKESTDKEYGIMHYSPVVYVGKPVERNAGAKQIEVTSSCLYARVGHSTSDMKLGFVNKGFYNVVDVYEESKKRTWYNVGEFWCASDGCTFHDVETKRYKVTFASVDEQDVKSLEMVAEQLGTKITKTLLK